MAVSFANKIVHVAAVEAMKDVPVAKDRTRSIAARRQCGALAILDEYFELRNSGRDTEVELQPMNR